MKKKPKKNTTTSDGELSVAELHAKKQLERLNSSLQKRAEEKKKQSEKIFKARVKNAPDDKVPMTSRTKAYYRYSQSFPGDVDGNGFRLNEEAPKKIKTSTKILFILLLSAVFAVAATAVFTALIISNREPAVAPDPVIIPEEMHGLYITPEVLAGGSEEIKEELLSAGCNTAVIPFKEKSGRVCFKNPVSGSVVQDGYIADAWKTVENLAAEGIGTVCYLSCFADSAAALDGNKGISSGEGIFKDSAGGAWLDPYSDEACDYLLGLIKAASGGSFGYILLDNVSYPYSYGSDTPHYSGGSGSPADNNAELNYFIDLAVSAAGDKKIIVNADAYGFCGSTEENGRYAGNIINNTCMNFAVDLRFSLQDKSVKDTYGLFTYMKEMPEVFVIDAAGMAENISAEHEKELVFGCIENSAENTVYIEALGICGINNYILF